MRFPIKGGRLLLAGIISSDPTGHDDVSKDTKTYKSYLERKPDPNETGWTRLRCMFTLDEYGSISSELNSVYQAGFFGFFVGALYGGFIHSRQGYFNFMDNNQATSFSSHLDAKRKLQNDFTTNFAKGSFKWGWRIGLFTTSYFGIISCISVYRSKSSIYEYLAAGSITGALYKVNMGLRGAAAGGIIGGFLGGVAGVASLTLLYFTGTSMEEIRYWQNQWRLDRERSVQEALKVQEAKINDTPPIHKLHDEVVQHNKSLENVK